MKIAIVTFEFEGLTRNGGIGTAYRRLAELLVRRGHSVTVVFMPFGRLGSGAAREMKRLKRQGIAIVAPKLRGTLEPRHTSESYHLGRSLAVYESLRGKSFDVIHGPDNCALLYYSLLARKLGLDFARSRFVIGAHGSQLWACEANRMYGTDSIFLSELDRRSIEMADHLVSPSAYMLGYMKTKGWKVPGDSRVIPNVNRLEPPRKEEQREPSRAKTRRSPTIVYFGRLEPRKGIYLFLIALRQLLATDPRLGRFGKLNVVFLGKDIISTPESSIESRIRAYLALFKSRVALEFVGNSSAEQAMKFLAARPEALVCLPSLLDNSPYVVVEALELGLNFISSSSGGQPELIDPADHGKVLFKPRPEALAEALRARIRSVPLRARASKIAMDANESWLRFHDGLRAKMNSSRPPVGAFRPRVSVILGTDGSDVPARTLRSVLNQDYPNIELCLPRGTPIAGKRLKVTRFDPSGNSPLWRAGARAASGKYVLFLSGSELADRGALSAWVRAAEQASKSDRRFVCLSTAEELASSRAAALKRRLVTPNTGWVSYFSQRFSSPHSLWRTDEFVKHAHASDRSLFDELAATEVLSSLRGSGKDSDSLPLTAIRVFDSNELSSVELPDPYSPIRKVKDAGKDSRPLLYYAAGLMSESQALNAQIQSLKAEMDRLRWDRREQDKRFASLEKTHKKLRDLLRKAIES